ncbi:MAG: hypothetical protein ACPG19_00865 [Saprospiraceae bacterium]
MKNPTLKILAVVSVIIMAFGGLSVFLAMQYKSVQKENIILKAELEEVKGKLEACK